MVLPPDFVDRIQRVFGDRGRSWLHHLPGLVTTCRARWHLRQGSPCPTLRLNYIELTTTATGQAVALKIGVPHAELYSEMAALRLYDGRGAVPLLDADRELGAMLLAHLRPGTMLWQLGDNRRESAIAASIMARLPVPPPDDHALPSFGAWIERAFRLTRTSWDPDERMPRRLVDAAESAFDRICQHSPGDVVLHGDLHHENVLYDAQAGWTAIDPKGVIGPACLEVGRFLHNRLPGRWSPERRAAALRERVAVFSAALGLSPATIAACGLVDCVLSHCWSFEDEALGPDWPIGVETAGVLRAMS